MSEINITVRKLSRKEASNYSLSKQWKSLYVISSGKSKKVFCSAHRLKDILAVIEDDNL